MSEPQTTMDKLLRRSVGTEPVPGLPPDFERRVMRRVREGSRTRGRYRRRLLGSYGLVSAAACAVVMHGQGLSWTSIAIAILGPLAVVVAAVPLLPRLRRI